MEVSTLFIYAENDIRPSWPIRQLSALITHTQFIEIKGAEHYIWLRNKEELSKILHELSNVKINYTNAAKHRFGSFFN